MISMSVKRKVKTPFLAALILASSLGAAHADPTTSTSMSSRLDHVERLLTESSAARKIEESGDPEALDLKAQATSHFDNARRFDERGDDESAQVELREAIRLMTTAVQATKGDGAVSSKEASDFARRRESVRALASAHDRIATEKGEKQMNRALQDKVSADLIVADTLLEQGKPDDARAALDATYEVVKVSLEGLRGGDTLVRELSFETKRDEYDYELDRNDTHQMLIKVLLAEKLESSPMRASAEKFIVTAGELRSQAEVSAGKKQYEQAIELLEKSTKELIRAIRSAGVYIPG
jgi:tetratricopeptide (TPR) repeat protein